MPKLVKQIKEDAILNIKVNKTYYLMAKHLSLHIFNEINENERLKIADNIKNKKYEDMSDTEKAFYTTALLLSEIEKQAKETNNLEEKEILLPGDEGFVMPKLPNED